MALLGKKRPPRAASGKSGLARGASVRVSDVPSAAGEAPALLHIERLAHDGRGIARLAGKTLFVDRALPGERVEVAIHRTRKRFDEAHVKKRLIDAPERVEPPCHHFGQCGGCDLQHLEVPAQRAHKHAVVQDLLLRQGIAWSEPVAALNGEQQGYRRRARLGVKVDGSGQVHLGFRAAGSHHLVDIAACPVLVTPLQRLLAPLRALLTALEAPRLVGHIELLATDAACVVLVRQLKAHANDQARWAAFVAEHDARLAMWQGREAPELHWWGEPVALSDTLALPGLPPITLAFEPGDFLQVNAEVNRQMVAHVVAWLAPQGAQVVDLFAGIGNFSLPLAAAGASVHAVEGAAAMVERLAGNARANGLAVTAQQADLFQADKVSALFDAYGAADAVVLDPPRSGALEVCRALAARPVSRVAYVSCDPATLARDAALLVQAGYRIRQVAVADMFLHTAHMETLMLFEYAQ